ncbi:KH domain-containing protein [Candidatus Uhrbacteria bacterium]|nr:KH domain-containing protein [Candidatus Uhrbacteria bacterium]
METAEAQLAHLTTIMAQALVDHPDDVAVTYVAGARHVVIEIRIHSDDVGKVIGAGGAHASAMRTLLFAAAGKLRRSVTLEIFDPEPDRRRVRRYPYARADAYERTLARRR